MKKVNNVRGLKMLHPAPKAASKEWCEAVKKAAMESVLKTAAEGNLTAGDLVGLMKIRKSLVELIRPKQQFVWQDPPHWNQPQTTEPDKAA